MAANNDAAIALYNSTIQDMRTIGLDFVVAFMAESYQAAKTAVGVDFAWPAYQAGYVAPTTGPNGDFNCYKYKD